MDVGYCKIGTIKTTNNLIKGDKMNNEIKVGDVVTMIGENMRGDEKVFTFTVKTVTYEAFDETDCTGPEMTFTSGHRFCGDRLQTRRSTNVGRYFTEIFTK